MGLGWEGACPSTTLYIIYKILVGGGGGGGKKRLVSVHIRVGGAKGHAPGPAAPVFLARSNSFGRDLTQLLARRLLGSPESNNAPSSWHSIVLHTARPPYILCHPKLFISFKRRRRRRRSKVLDGGTPKMGKQQRDTWYGHRDTQNMNWYCRTAAAAERVASPHCC